MNPPHGVGHGVAGMACGHVVGVQGTSRPAAGGYGEILLALLITLLLIGVRHRMLEAGGVGGVDGDGHNHSSIY